MKKKERSKHNRDGSRSGDRRPWKPTEPVDKEAIAFTARQRLEANLGSGALSRQHPSPWNWDNGVLKDAKQRPIPGAQRISADA